jgi:hypothetical protein
MKLSKKELLYITSLQKSAISACKKYGVITIDSHRGIHLSTRTFLDTFPVYTFTDFDDEYKMLCYSKNENSFFCLVNQDEIKEFGIK